MPAGIRPRSQNKPGFSQMATSFRKGVPDRRVPRHDLKAAAQTPCHMSQLQGSVTEAEPSPERCSATLPITTVCGSVDGILPDICYIDKCLFGMAGVGYAYASRQPYQRMEEVGICGAGLDQGQRHLASKAVAVRAVASQTKERKRSENSPHRCTSAPRESLKQKKVPVATTGTFRNAMFAQLPTCRGRGPPHRRRRRSWCEAAGSTPGSSG